MKPTFAATFPIHACTLDVSESCNLRCSYCFTGCKTKGLIRLADAYAAIDWLLLDDVSGPPIDRPIELTFFGGEPMLGFEQIIKPAVEYGRQRAEECGKKLSFGMTTNGTLMGEDQCRWCAENSVRYMISWDGARESQNRFRVYADGTGSFDDLMCNAEHMVHYQPRTVARITYSRENAPNLFEDVQFLWDIGFRRIAITAVQEVDWNKAERAEMAKQFDLIADWYIKLWQAGQQPDVKFIEDFVGSIFRPNRGHPCGAGRTYIGITTDGYLFPCHRFHDMGDEAQHEGQRWCIGSVKEGLFDVVTRDQFLTYPSHRPEVCRDCVYLIAGQCQGNCYAVNKAAGGHDNIRTVPSISCYIVDVSFRAALKVLKALATNDAFLKTHLPIKDDGQAFCGQGDTCNSCHCLSNSIENPDQPNPDHEPEAEELLALRRSLVARQVKAAEAVAAGRAVTLKPVPTVSLRDLTPARLGWLEGGQQDLADRIDAVLELVTTLVDALTTDEEGGGVDG